MEELKLLYKELQERKDHLEGRKKTKITEGRIAENLLTIVRVQQLLIPLVVGQSEQLVCDCMPDPKCRIENNKVICNGCNKERK